MLAALVLLFPDGRLPSRLWRWPLRVYLAAFAGLIAANAVAIAGALATRPLRVDSNGGLAAVDHLAGWFNAVQSAFTVVVFALALAFVAQQALSWRRAAMAMIGQAPRQVAVKVSPEGDKLITSGAHYVHMTRMSSASSGNLASAPMPGECEEAGQHKSERSAQPGTGDGQP